MADKQLTPDEKLDALMRASQGQVGRGLGVSMPVLNCYETWALFVSLKYASMLRSRSDEAPAFTRTVEQAFQALGDASAQELAAKLEPIAAKCYAVMLDDRAFGSLGQP